MSAITQQQWRLVRTVVDTGRLTAAARQLGVSGPAASKMLRLVEERLGVTLFDRVGRVLRPTRFGLEFAEAASRILQLTERVELRARLVGEGHEGQVAVGCGGLALASVLPEALGRLLQESPRVRVSAAVEPFPDLLRGLVEWRLDLVVADPTGFTGGGALDHYEVRPLRQLPVPILARPGHPIFRRGSATLPDLLDFPWVLPGLAPRAAEMLRQGLATLPAAHRRDLEQRLADQPHVLLHDPHACLEVAARTDCITGGPTPLVASWIASRRLKRIPTRIRLLTNIAVIRDPQRTLTPTAERLFQALLD